MTLPLTGFILPRRFRGRTRTVRSGSGVAAASENPMATKTVKKKSSTRSTTTAKAAKKKVGASGKATKKAEKVAKKVAKKVTKKTVIKTTKAPKVSKKKPVAKTVAKKTVRKVAAPTPAKAPAVRAAKKTKRPKKPALTPERRKMMRRFRKLLVDKQRSVVQVYLNTKGNTRAQTLDGTEDYIDYAVSSYDRYFTLSLSEMERKQLVLIEDSLKRIDRKEYGDCLHCGIEIPPKRLEVEPWAKHCIRCAELEERGLLIDHRFGSDEDDEEEEGAVAADLDFAGGDDDTVDDGDRLTETTEEDEEASL